MTPFTVIPLTNVNLRTGPGISYEIAGQIPYGYELNVSEAKKDGSGTFWYKVDGDMWVSSKYVKQPNQIENPNAGISLMSLLPTTTPIGNASATVNTESLINSATGLISSTTGVNLGILNTITGIAGNTAQESILTRRIYGTPFQFMDTADMRPDENSSLGVEFAANIMAETPILSLLPGIPNYLPELAGDAKLNLTKQLTDMIDESSKSISSMATEKLSEKQGLDFRFFEFTSRTREYMLYVNLLCRMCAIYLGLGESLVPGTSTKYCEFNWFNWRLSNSYGAKTTKPENVKDFAGRVVQEAINSAKTKIFGGDKKTDKTDAAKTASSVVNGTTLSETGKESGYVKVARSMNGISEATNSMAYQDVYYMDFFVKPPSYSESFGNQTSESMLAGAIQQGANLQKEMAFFLGAAVSDNVVSQESLNNFNKSSTEMINSYFKNSAAMRNAMSRFVTGSTAVLTGSNLIFPEIWQNSSYDRNFQVDICLSTPYGDTESIFLEIMVPLMHLLAFVLPRQTSPNSFTSPFLVRASLPGFFSCDMGLVKDMQITKGGQSGDCWNIDGLPTEVNVSLSIQDLYNSLSMGNFHTKQNVWNFIHNTSLIDFIGVQCGLNMRSNEWSKKIDLIGSLLNNTFKDVADYVGTSTQEEISQSVFRGVMAMK